MPAIGTRVPSSICPGPAWTRSEGTEPQHLALQILRRLRPESGRFTEPPLEKDLEAKQAVAPPKSRAEEPLVPEVAAISGLTPAVPDPSRRV